jgi:hypothetical protein
MLQSKYDLVLEGVFLLEVATVEMEILYKDGTMKTKTISYEVIDGDVAQTSDIEENIQLYQVQEVIK